MDNTLQDLLSLVEKGNVEQRCAALLVLGALKISNAATGKLVGSLLDNPNPVLKDYALRYFEEVQPKSNMAQLLKMLDDGDKPDGPGCYLPREIATTGGWYWPITDPSDWCGEFQPKENP